MRKLLLVATMMIPFAVSAKVPAPAAAIGDLSLSQTSAGSTAGVGSAQGTQANTKVSGNGAVVLGTVSGNYTSVQTTAAGRAGLGGSATQTGAQQINAGGTVSSGLAANTGSTIGRPASAPSGSTGGGQSSQASGASTATASTANIGGGLSVRAVGRNGHTGM
jgi:hypothetical protein